MSQVPGEQLGSEQLLLTTFISDFGVRACACAHACACAYNCAHVHACARVIACATAILAQAPRRSCARVACRH
eukprot:1216320-Alexandrium_andersonii.AAC.1